MGNALRDAYEFLSERPGLCVTLVVIVCFVVINPFRVEESYICPRCGMTRTKTYHQLFITYWVSNHVEKTLISEVLSDNGLAADHRHNWQWMTKGGTFGCHTHGPWLSVYDSANNERVAMLLQSIIKYKETAAARRWTSLILSPDGNHVSLEISRRDMGFPAEGFQQKAQFDQWWAANEAKLRELFPQGFE